MRDNIETIKKVVLLRKRGMTYGQIRSHLGKDFPKSSLSYWCRGIILTRSQQDKIERNSLRRIYKARKKALKINRENRVRYLEGVRSRVVHLRNVIKQEDVAKIALAMLYLGEGGKTTSSLMFGNSDELTIRLFLKFLRQSFNIDERKFRCTVQCRADQDVILLKRHWSRITGIPTAQFYKPQVDPRTVGRPSRKSNYKGVCRIDYLSADVVNEIRAIVEVLN